MSDPGGNPRRARVAQTMRDLLAQMIDRDIKDPRARAAGLVSVNHVELNRDMSSARVYVSFFTADERAIAEAVRGLQAAARFLRGPLARKMNLARAPELRFVHDPSQEFVNRLSALVREDEARRPTEDDDDSADSADEEPSPAVGAADATEEPSPAGGGGQGGGGAC
jgi:ribosome-binding factor A